jgi:hypothetical protein
MTSQIKGNTGSQGRVVEVCSMESKKDDGSEKTRFLPVRGKIYKLYTTQQKTKDQVTSSTLKRSITQREEEGEVIEMDGDVTRPSTVKQTHRTLYIYFIYSFMLIYTCIYT